MHSAGTGATLFHAKMHSCIFFSLSFRKQEYYLSLSDTVTTLKVVTCVALKHGAALGQSVYFFLELGATNDY